MLITFLYIDIYIGRSISASEIIRVCLFVFSITSHSIGLLLGIIMTNDLFPFKQAG